MGREEATPRTNLHRYQLLAGVVILDTCNTWYAWSIVTPVDIYGPDQMFNVARSAYERLLCATLTSLVDANFVLILTHNPTYISAPEAL